VPPESAGHEIFQRPLSPASNTRAHQPANKNLDTRSSNSETQQQQLISNMSGLFFTRQWRVCHSLKHHTLKISSSCLLLPAACVAQHRHAITTHTAATAKATSRVPPQRHAATTQLCCSKRYRIHNILHNAAPYTLCWAHNLQHKTVPRSQTPHHRALE
jgi:hypothetical protein